MSIIAGGQFVLFTTKVRVSFRLSQIGLQQGMKNWMDKSDNTNL